MKSCGVVFTCSYNEVWHANKKYESFSVLQMKKGDMQQLRGNQLYFECLMKLPTTAPLAFQSHSLNLYLYS